MVYTLQRQKNSTTQRKRTCNFTHNPWYTRHARWR